MTTSQAPKAPSDLHRIMTNRANLLATSVAEYLFRRQAVAWSVPAIEAVRKRAGAKVSS